MVLLGGEVKTRREFYDQMISEGVNKDHAIYAVCKAEPPTIKNCGNHGTVYGRPFLIFKETEKNYAGQFLDGQLETKTIPKDFITWRKEFLEWATLVDGS